MYSSDRTNTLIRIVKDYDKNIVFRDNQMHYLKKEIIFIFFLHFV